MSHKTSYRLWIFLVDWTMHSSLINVFIIYFINCVIKLLNKIMIYTLNKSDWWFTFEDVEGITRLND